MPLVKLQSRLCGGKPYKAKFLSGAKLQSRLCGGKPGSLGGASTPTLQSRLCGGKRLKEERGILA